MQGSAHWRNASPLLSKKSGTTQRPVRQSFQWNCILLITCSSPAVSAHFLGVTALSSSPLSFLSSVSLRYSRLHCLTSAHVHLPGTDLYFCCCPLCFSLTNIQVDRLQVFACCLRQLSAHLGQAWEGAKKKKSFFIKCCQASLASLHLSGKPTSPCGCAGLSVANRDQTLRRLLFHVMVSLIAQV